MKSRRVLTWILLVAITWGLLFTAQRLVMPKYQEQLLEGGLIADYYAEPDKDHDVLFIGDCEVYENICPITLWQEYGLTSFIRGSAQQLIWHSAYLLEDTLRYEQPDLVVFNVLAMKYGQPQSEAYNRMALDAMPLSRTKIRAIRASMMEEETMLSYLFPLLRFHDRWQSLTREDLTYLWRKETISHNGYLMRIDVKPLESLPAVKPLPDYSLDPICWAYLDQMHQLCQEQDIPFVLLKAPSLYPHWYDEWDQQLASYAQENNLLYVNTLPLIDQMGIDFNTDTYDAGLHLNRSGAEKCTRYLGQLLVDTFALTDRRSDPQLAASWAEKSKAYQEQIQAQQEELDRYGYLKAFRYQGP